MSAFDSIMHLCLYVLEYMEYIICLVYIDSAVN